MAFEKQINKTVEIGASKIEFMDDAKMVKITYTTYEDGSPKSKYKVIHKSFDNIMGLDAEAFASVIGYIQTLCDSLNPENPENIEA